MSLNFNPSIIAENFKYIKLGFEGSYTSSKQDNILEIQINDLSENQKKEIMDIIEYGE